MSCCVPGCFNVQSVQKDLSYHVFPHPEREYSRHREWVTKVKNPKLKTMQPMAIYKRLRVCKIHFDKDCFNGGCKRLQNTAIPTLFLQPVAAERSGVVERNISRKNLMKIARPDVDGYSFVIKKSKIEKLHTLPKTEHQDITEFKQECSDTEYSVPEVFEEEYLEDFEVELKNDKNMKIMEIDKIKAVYYNDYVVEELPANLLQDFESQELEYESLVEGEEQYELLDVIETESSPVAEQNRKILPASLTEEFFQKCRTDFYDCPKNQLAQNVCSRIDPFEACLSRKVLENTQHVYTYKIENEGKPLTNQKSSGRCWIFATLNCIRIQFIKQYNLDEFEFSQAYLFYWDKIERCNYFLNNIIETARRGEEVDGRLVSFLLCDPTCDGGQWDMIVNVINKHGLMPKKCFPESYSCEASTRMNCVLKSKLREYAKVLRDLITEGASDEDLKSKITSQMNEIYNVVGICLGIPSEKFTWEYYDKSKKYLSIGPIKPVDFYEKYVKPYFNVDDKVCLVTDPRPTNPYGRGYTVDCLGNVVGGRPVFYNNQPVELLMDLVTKGIKAGEPIWFGCEVNKRFAGKQGIEDLDVHDFKLVFGVDIQVTLSKADRLLYGESMMTHAMVFTGASVDQNGTPTKFRVENSWGEDRCEKGYLTMSAEWFKEFVFEVVVDRSIVPPDVLSVFDLTPTLLPAWDPMGTLAK